MQVRRLALMALAAAAPASVPDDVRGRVIRDGLADREYVVRYEALRVYGRSLTSATVDWDPVFAALSDPSPHVALLAIDLLGNAQARPDAAVERLRREARTLPAAPAAPAIGGSGNRTASTAEWHRAAHALVSLAKIAPDAARELLPAFVASPLWPARMYAARAAAIVRDADLLLRFVEDSRDNVREAALGGLRTLRGHDADDLYIAALQRPDYQLVMTAAQALEKTPQPARAVPPMLAALARITAERRDTSRDPRLALIARIGELGQPADAQALMPYTTDFDPQVAATAAALIAKWTGQAPAVAPRPLPVERVQLADIERLRSARVMVTMAGRGVFELELLTDDAPATVVRFVRLARAGYYNGLTFHRVVPNFLIQGGSPGANEFMGDGAYLRDELGLQPHVRGSVGISTRGRDTGDAQICPDLVDNPRLDHDYTVFARVVAGLDVLDRVLECYVIERIDIVDR
jgi:cyclophilin family peptidyl-prolyl cis-trans isomerase/HEAT repeat protein